tara:strand:- start:366 stop:842 length:477 start_codon:yes stop_codon:yes gene_type:complete
MANYVPYEFKKDLLKGNFDFPSDTIYLALYTSVSAYPVASATVYSSATAGQVAATGNYATDGRTCGAASVANAGSQPQSIYLNFAGDGSGANTITWSTSTITAAYGVMYQRQGSGGTTANQRLVAVLDFGGSKSSSNGDFKVVFPTVSTGADAILSIT